MSVSCCSSCGAEWVHNPDLVLGENEFGNEDYEKTYLASTG